MALPHYYTSNLRNTSGSIILILAEARAKATVHMSHRCYHIISVHVYRLYVQCTPI